MRIIMVILFFCCFYLFFHFKRILKNNTHSVNPSLVWWGIIRNFHWFIFCLRNKFKTFDWLKTVTWPCTEITRNRIKLWNQENVVSVKLILGHHQWRSILSVQKVHSFTGDVRPLFRGLSCERKSHMLFFLSFSLII